MTDDQLILLLKNITTDRRWKLGRNARWLYHATVDGARFGAILTTCKQEDTDFLLNFEEMEKLRACRRNFDRIFVVAVRNNGIGREYVCHVEAEALWERLLQHKQTRPGPFGPLWILSRGEIDGTNDDDDPFSIHTTEKPL